MSLRPADLDSTNVTDFLPPVKFFLKVRRRKAGKRKGEERRRRRKKKNKRIKKARAF